MMRLGFPFMMAFCIACADVEQEQPGSNGSAENGSLSVAGTVEAAAIETVVFKNDTMAGPVPDGWGFDLLMNGKRFIHQPTVPVVSGNLGFASEDQARRAGDLVADKIRKGQMPPALDRSDLKSLGVSLP